MMRTLKGMDLQLFAGEKTEKATPKKRKESRDKGQVLRSTELSSAFLMLSIFLGFKLLGSGIFSKLQQEMTKYLGDNLASEDTFTSSGIFVLGMDSAISFGLILGPIFIIVLAAGLAINYLQVGFLFTSKSMAFKLSRINPLEGFKKMLSMKSVVQLIKTILKTIIIGYIVYSEFMNNLDTTPGLMGQDILPALSVIMKAISNIAFKAGIGLAILGVLDYLYQWWEYEKELRMSKQEVKDEHKQMDGDPLLRARIKQKQREIGMSRMMQQIPDADVVITNPTHFAIAILYESDTKKAPVVVAKGQDYIALKIKKIAEQHNVHIVENKNLARSLYQSTQIGEEIPMDMYKAVAEILAYVYRLKQSI